MLHFFFLFIYLYLGDILLYSPHCCSFLLLSTCINYARVNGLASTFHCSFGNSYVKHSQWVGVCVNMHEKQADRTLTYRPVCRPHSCFLIGFIPSVCQTLSFSLFPLFYLYISLSHPLLTYSALQVEHFTPVISGEDVGYPATLAFGRTQRLERLMATCCSLSVPLTVGLFYLLI